MATIMARVTRSGTLVGPGTKRKFRPGILGPGIKSSRSEIEAAERSRNKISYSTCGPMSSIRNALLSNRTERILSRGLIGPRGEPAPTMTGWRIDREGYAAVPVLSNGTGGAPLELRSLFEQSLNEVP